MIKRIQTYIQQNSTHLLVLIIGFFIVYFTFTAFSRHDNFYSRRLDLGNMDQTVWNVLHGNGFTLTDPMGTSQQSRLAVHADFMLILFAPFYLIWSNPKMLVLLQIIVTGLGAIPVYWFARDLLKSKILALLFALIFLLYPPNQRNMLHDFHAVTLSATFFLFAYWFMHKEKYVRFLLFVILAALGKEQIWLTVGLMGFYIIGIKRKYFFGSIVATVGFAAFYLLLWHAIPAVTQAKQHFALTYLSEFGGDQNNIIKNILLNPLEVFRTMMLPDRLFYYFQLLFPLGFLPLFSPLVMIFALPSVLINVLSNNGLFRQIDYQYNTTVIPFLFVAAIQGYVVLKGVIGRIKNKGLVKISPYIISGSVLVSIFISSMFWGELPGSFSSRFWFFTTALPEKKIMQSVEKSIDSTYSVSATNNIGAHFSQREFLYNFPINANTSDYSIIYLGDPYAWPSGDDQKKAVDNLLKDNNYELVAQQGKFYAFKKKSI